MTIHELQSASHTWLNIPQPSQEDVSALRKRFPYIHPLNLEDVLSRLERPKVDADEQYLFVVLQFPVWDQANRISRAAEVNLILGRRFVVSMHDDSLKPLRSFFAQCQQDETVLQAQLGRGAGFIFYSIIDQLVDYCFPILRKVNVNVDRLEESVFTDEPRRIIREIAEVRRDIIALRRIIRHQIPVVEELESSDHPLLHEDMEEYYGDIVDHLYNTWNILEENHEVIASLSETADRLVTHRTNEVVRILTVISVVLLPMTLVTGIWGMNIRLPFSQNPSAFFLISVIMIGIALAMFWFFRRRHWL
ncbi:MAG: magnesium transporter CorA family protein [Chloroflexi bacterium]|nr:magnesium transporter CorA family protein [Chloroflexota bacterium]